MRIITFIFNWIVILTFPLWATPVWLFVIIAGMFGSEQYHEFGEYGRGEKPFV